MQRYENKCKGLADEIFISLKNKVRPNAEKTTGKKMPMMKYSGPRKFPAIKFKSITIPAPAHKNKIVLKKPVT